MTNGDILLVDYIIDPIGWFIKWVTHSKYNHVAWGLNEFFLIESTGRGIKIAPVSKYLYSNLYKTKLIRLRDLSKKQINEITKILLEQRCQTPYWKFFISYFLVAFHKKGLVQNCSKFIFNAMKKIGYHLNEHNEHYIVPEDFNKAKQAENITGLLPMGSKHGRASRFFGEILHHPARE